MFNKFYQRISFFIALCVCFWVYELTLPLFVLSMFSLRHVRSVGRDNCTHNAVNIAFKRRNITNGKEITLNFL